MEPYELRSFDSDGTPSLVLASVFQQQVGRHSLGKKMRAADPSKFGAQPRTHPCKFILHSKAPDTPSI